MNVRQIREVVQQNLNRAGFEKTLGAAELLGIINRAKDEVVARMELWDEDLFTARQTFNVAQGDPSITLPSDFRRLITLTRTDGNRDNECTIVDMRERAERVGANWPYDQLAGNGSGEYPLLYAESGKLYFAENTGAPASMTLLMRYRKRVADATEADASAGAEFEGVGEWDRAIANLATARALPRSNPEQARYMEEYANDVDLFGRAINRRMDDSPIRIRMTDCW